MSRDSEALEREDNKIVLMNEEGLFEAILKLKNKEYETQCEVPLTSNDEASFLRVVRNIDPVLRSAWIANPTKDNNPIYDKIISLFKNNFEDSNCEKTSLVADRKLNPDVERNKPHEELGPLKKNVAHEDIDNDLVDNAYKEISDIVSICAETAVGDIGMCILKKFYDGSIENARKKKCLKEQSLNKLCERLRGSSLSAPSKSYLYNTVGLIVQEDDIKKDADKDCFLTYGKLSLSHKISLLSVKKIELKKELISKIASEKLSFRALQEEKKKYILPKKEQSLLAILDNPETLIDENNDKAVNRKLLSLESENKLQKIQRKAQKKQENIEYKIGELNEELNKYKKYLKNYKNVITDVDKIIKSNIDK